MNGDSHRHPWRHRFHAVIFEADTPAGKMFDIALIVSIVLSVIAVMLDSIAVVRTAYGPLLYGVEWGFTLLFTVMVMVVIFGSLIYLIEGEASGFSSIPRSVYWAIVTLTTVGYGDISPKNQSRSDAGLRDHDPGLRHYRRTHRNRYGRNVPEISPGKTGEHAKLSGVRRRRP